MAGGHVKKATKKFLKKAKKNGKLFMRKKNKPMFKSSKREKEEIDERAEDHGEEEFEEEEIPEDGGFLGHSAELEELKKTDPEFYAHLKQNDPQLLEFQDEEDHEETDAPVQKDIAKKFEKLQGDCSSRAHILEALDLLRSAIRAATPAPADEDAERIAERRQWLNQRSLHHRVLVFGISVVPEKIRALVGAGEANQDLEQNSMWSNKIAKLVKSFLKSILNFLSHSSNAVDPKMARFTFSRITSKMLDLFGAFSMQSRHLLKLAFKIWGTSPEVFDDENADKHQNGLRVDAFMLIRTFVTSMIEIEHSRASEVLETSLKLGYVTFVRSSSTVNEKRWGGIQFMLNSLVELYLVDPNTSYRHAFVYLRQMAINLKTVTMNPTAISSSKTTKAAAASAASSRLVYSWQFMNSLRFWTSIICTALDPLPQLAYPLSQIILGLMNVCSPNRFLPCRVWCFRLLSQISKQMNIYIPYAAEIVSSLQSKCFLIANLKKGAAVTTNAKIPDIQYLLKLSSTNISESKPLQDTIADQVFDLLKDFFVQQCRSIAFPELSFPIIRELGAEYFKRPSTSFRVQKLARTLQGQLKLHSEWIQKRRSSVKFSPQDSNAVQQFISEDEASKSPMMVFNSGSGNASAVRQQQSSSSASTSRYALKQKIARFMSSRNTSSKESDDESSSSDEMSPEEGNSIPEIENYDDPSYADILEDFIMEESV
jgi:nucleolar complex protein 2